MIPHILCRPLFTDDLYNSISFWLQAPLLKFYSKQYNLETIPVDIQLHAVISWLRSIKADKLVGQTQDSYFLKPLSILLYVLCR